MTQAIFSFPVTAAPTGPTWLNNIAVGSWGQVTANQQITANPGTSSPLKASSAFFAFSGGVFAADYSTYGAIVVAGGGHNDYYGNEVYVQDLSVANPLWALCGTSYPTPNATPSDLEGELAGSVNGDKPGSVHSMNSMQYLPASIVGGKGQLLLAVSYSMAQQGGGHSSARSHVFDLVTNLWSRFYDHVFSLWFTNTGFQDISGCTAYDSTRKVVWWYPQSSFRNPRRLDVTTGISSVVSGTITTQFTDAAVYVPTRDRIYHFSGMVNPWTITVFDAATGAALSSSQPAGHPTNSAVGGSAVGATNQGSNGGGIGAVWCPDHGPNGKIMVYPHFTAHRVDSNGDDGTNAVINTGKLYGYDPVTGVWSLITNITTIPPSYSGVWGRLQYAPALKCLILVPSTTSGTYAFRVA